MRKKLGFALGAGGARGVAHIGFLQAMDEEGIRPDFISGSSMGSIVGACYAKGMTPEEMRAIAGKLKAGDIIDFDLMPLTKLGLMKWTKVRRMMSKFLDDCTFDRLDIPFCCVAVDIKSGKLKTFREGGVVDAVLASSSMPTVFRPVEKDGMQLIDGSVLCRVPVRQVKHLGAEVVVAVDVLGQCAHVEKVPNVFSLIMRIYDIMDARSALEERRRCRHAGDLWLEPDMGEVSQYAVKYYEVAYEAGYQLGKENAAAIRALAGIEEGEKKPAQLPAGALQADKQTDKHKAAAGQTDKAAAGNTDKGKAAGNIAAADKEGA